MRAAVLALLLMVCGTFAAEAAPWRITKDHWDAQDEIGYGRFITALGDSGCNSSQSCLRDPANPYRGSDGAFLDIDVDCAKLPYLLRAYYAWKNGLPFSYVNGVAGTRFGNTSNRIVGRASIIDNGGGINGAAALRQMIDSVYSATFRTDARTDHAVPSDFYSPAIQPGSIRPGTIIYDTNAHIGIVYRVEASGRIHYMDAHPDFTITRSVYGAQFGRSSAALGWGLKNWRPLQLTGARRNAGRLVGGRYVFARNNQIRDFSLVQYFGNGPRPTDAQWKSGGFMLNNQRMDYYDFVRASLSGGRLRFNPVQEIADLVLSNCADLSYRAEAIDISLAAGIQNRPQPGRLPLNIYGTEGDWETYSTPSRDARLKTAFKEVRDNAERFLTLWRARDPQIVYNGFDLAGDMLGAYDRAAARCTVSYKRTDGSDVRFGYEEARRRLFRFSFDPYHCVERRWGADNVESATCRDTMVKRRWYDAQQRLRNQLDRSYEAKMDFNLLELEEGRGGVAQPPDVDARAYLMSQRGR